MGKRRALVLVGVHLLVLAHILHWKLAGTTLSPVEPSEAMETIRSGYVNAGFVFFAVVLIATAVLGRFFCGWGCHLVAYQDGCAWLLKKVGIKPRLFRSRLLLLAPLALAVYMFLYPLAYRFLAGLGRPEFQNHLTKTDFWETFPGPVMAILTFLVCGGLAVYLLGAKGYCTYGCPYGGFFTPLDKLAVGRIKVTDACEHCGHCTSVCTSNVKVHEEVAQFGMVVNPGCMKCMDCVSVCPNDALYFGFARPALRAKPATPRKPARFDLTIGEEILLAVIVLASFLAYRGLYGAIPALLALALAAITGFVAIKLIHTLRGGNVRFQNLQLRRGGRWTPVGALVSVATVLVLALTGQSLAVQYHAQIGHLRLASLDLGDNIWKPGYDPSTALAPELRRDLESTLHHLERADRIGMAPTYQVLADLVWGYTARNEIQSALDVVDRMASLRPDLAEPHRGRAGLLRRQGRVAEAVDEYRKALAIEPLHRLCRTDLLDTLLADGRIDDAVAVCAEAVRQKIEPAYWGMMQGNVLTNAGRLTAAEGQFRKVLDDHPQYTPARSALAQLLTQAGRLSEALEQYRIITGEAPDDVASRVEVAKLLLLLGQSDDFKRELAALERYAGESAEISELLARQAMRDGDPAAATARLKTAVRLAPGRGESQYNLARLLLHHERDAVAALPHLEAAVALRPDIGAVHRDLAIVYRELGRHDDARRHVQAALALDAGDQLARDLLNSLPLHESP